VQGLQRPQGCYVAGEAGRMEGGSMRPVAAIRRGVSGLCACGLSGLWGTQSLLLKMSKCKLASPGRAPAGSRCSRSRPPLRCGTGPWPGTRSCAPQATQALVCNTSPEHHSSSQPQAAPRAAPCSASTALCKHVLPIPGQVPSRPRIQLRGSGLWGQGCRERTAPRPARPARRACPPAA